MGHGRHGSPFRGTNRRIVIPLTLCAASTTILLLFFTAEEIARWSRRLTWLNYPDMQKTSRTLVSVALASALALSPLFVPRNAEARFDVMKCIQYIMERLKVFGTFRAPDADPERLQDLVAFHEMAIRTGAKAKPREVSSFRLVGTPEGFDAYNPAGFVKTKISGHEVELFVARVEPHNAETGMFVGFYARKQDGSWYMVNGKIRGLPDLKLQDPFSTKFTNENGVEELILGGVEVFPRLDENGKAMVNDDKHPILDYRTVMYRDRGNGIDHLERFFEGDLGRKDDRIVGDIQYKPKGMKNYVLTRPQSGDPLTGGQGKVAIASFDKLEDLKPELLREAKIFQNQIAGRQWLGSNKAMWGRGALTGKIKVIGHYARFAEDGTRFYVAMAWVIDPVTNLVTGGSVLATRRDIATELPNAAKRADLDGVLFGTDFMQNADGTATLVYGATDSNAGVMIVDDPFFKLEFPDPK